MQGYTYTKNEHYPMEHLVFKTAPEDVERFLEVDHEVWTLMEAYAPGFDHIPFLYKEVWVNDNKPGELHMIFAWESIEAWRKIDQKPTQAVKARNSSRQRSYGRRRCEDAMVKRCET